MKDDIMVSINCMAYNHEHYIADALEGFIKQKTNFKFEVLIHDDASTDRTAEIIRSYEEKYPEIIKPIYEKENQYSKHNGTIRRLQSERIRGKYVALCEGDDYWIDENKLQRQVDFLENNPEYSLCIHSSINVNAETKQVLSEYKKSDEAVDITTADIILHEGEWMATNSMVFPAKYYINRPKEILDFPVGDYPLAMHLAFCGKVRCLPDVMSAYRVMSKNSWSYNILSKNTEANKRRINILKKMMNNMNDLDAFTKYKYHKYIQKKQIMMLGEIEHRSKQYGETHLFKEIFAQVSPTLQLLYCCARLKGTAKISLRHIFRRS